MFCFIIFSWILVHFFAYFFLVFFSLLVSQLSSVSARYILCPKNWAWELAFWKLLLAEPSQLKLTDVVRDLNIHIHVYMDQTFSNMKAQYLCCIQHLARTLIFMLTWFLRPVKISFQNCSILHPEIWEDPGAEDNRKEFYQRANG